MSTIPTSRPRLGHDASFSFHQWLAAQLGQCKWVVARSSKRLRSQGYDRFFTQKKYTALKEWFEKEAAMSDGAGAISSHLTEPNKELAAQRRNTFAGMAHWGGSGPAGKTCRECQHWDSQGYLASCGLLKDSPCAEFKKLMGGVSGDRIPHYALACKYFEPKPVPPAIEKR